MHRYATKRAIAISIRRTKECWRLTVNHFPCFLNLKASSKFQLMVSQTTHHKLNLLSHLLAGEAGYPDGFVAL